ncbi:MAG: response regulator receiver protein, partial [Mesorhizobium sp.]
REVKPNVIVNRFEQKMFDNGIKQADVQDILGEHFVGGISNNYRLVREAVDRGVPLHDIDPNANVVNDLKKIILPEEAVTTTAKSKSLFGLGKGLLKRKAG